jgi:hypothetical protein
MLHLVPTLESLVFEFLPEENTWTRIGSFTYDDCPSRHQLLQLDVLEGLACNPNPLPELQSLHINSWFAFCHELYAAAPFERMLASLQDICFLVQDTDRKGGHDYRPAADFWKDIVGPRILRLAVNLTSLAMKSSVEFASLSRLDLNSITIPSLAELSFTNFVWDDGIAYPQRVIPEAEDFIVRHKNTLKRLELHNCKISVPQDRSTPVHSWAAVWNRFAKELTVLVNLAVTYNFKMRYACFNQGYSFGSDSDSTSSSFLAGTEQDTPALEALIEITLERRALNASRTENLWWN